ncbi:DUF523 domain-containing protein [Aliiroseovarius sp. 2305UL8-7]|uniref:DUF523 domain-containing protein n=1 Tax=Aliiroseovarius conchicola TaxID=3121637 RepID=UPI003527A588
MTRLLISACLTGQPVRYDGRAKLFDHEHLERWRSAGRLVSFCPELAGGMMVPRRPAEIEPGFNGDDVLGGRARVHDDTGADVTRAFVIGAQLALDFALGQRCAYALLTENSPSCGSSVLHSGLHNGQTRDGFGVTTAALRAGGIQVFAPDQIEQLAAECAW